MIGSESAPGPGEVAATLGVAAATGAAVATGTAGVVASVALAGAAPSVLFGLVFASVFVAEGLGYAPPPAMDATRVVNAQDCSKPIDITKGNLKCLPIGAR